MLQKLLNIMVQTANQANTYRLFHYTIN